MNNKKDQQSKMGKEEKTLEEIFKICDKRKASASKIYSTPFIISTQNDDDENNYNKLRSVSAMHIRDGSERQELFQVKREPFKRSTYVLPDFHHNFVDRKIISQKTASLCN